MKKELKLLLFNIVIVFLIIVLYSPGLMALRLNDDSLIRSILALWCGIGLLTVFIIGNTKMLKPAEKRLITNSATVDITAANSILEQYKRSVHFAKIAASALDQIERLQKSITRAEMEISKKFEKGSMSWDKYNAVIVEANKVILENLVSIANRMQLFDEQEYTRLKNYKNDTIPDDIQEKQIALYEQNKELIVDAVSVNERLILSLDTMSVELSKAKDTEGDLLLDEISSLTGEVKYYI